jgi:hypothetical protein
MKIMALQGNKYEVGGKKVTKMPLSCLLPHLSKAAHCYFFFRFTSLTVSTYSFSLSSQHLLLAICLLDTLQLRDGTYLGNICIEILGKRLQYK